MAAGNDRGQDAEARQRSDRRLAQIDLVTRVLFDVPAVELRAGFVAAHARAVALVIAVMLYVRVIEVQAMRLLVVPGRCSVHVGQAGH